MKKSIMSLGLVGLLTLGGIAPTVSAKAAGAIMIVSAKHNYEDTIIAHSQDAAAKSHARHNIQDYQVVVEGKTYELFDLNNKMAEKPNVGIKELVKELEEVTSPGQPEEEDLEIESIT